MLSVDVCVSIFVEKNGPNSLVQLGACVNSFVHLLRFTFYRIKCTFTLMFLDSVCMLCWMSDAVGIYTLQSYGRSVCMYLCIHEAHSGIVMLLAKLLYYYLVFYDRYGYYFLCSGKKRQV